MGKWQTQQLVRFKMLVTVRDGCPRALSFLRKAQGDSYAQKSLTSLLCLSVP